MNKMNECNNHSGHECRIGRAERDLDSFGKKLDRVVSIVGIMAGLGIALQFAASIGAFDPIRTAIVAPVEQSIIMATYP